MERKFTWQFVLFLLLLLPFVVSAQPMVGILQAPQPTVCAKINFSQTGNQYWSVVTLRLENTCTTPLNLQNTIITFNNTAAVNTSFWGEFGTVSYPDNNLLITSELQSTNYLSSLFLHFAAGANSILPVGQSIKIRYGVDTATYIKGSGNVYLPGSIPGTTATLDLINNSLKPVGASQDYATIAIKNNGQLIKSVQLPWKGFQQVTNLMPGTYTVEPAEVTDPAGNIYQGTAKPPSLALSAGQKLASTVTYAAQSIQLGKINIQTAALPNVISGYPNMPQITLTQVDNGNTIAKAVTWNALTQIGGLAVNKMYRLATPDISFNGYRCTGTFTPVQVTAQATTPPTSALSYTCVQVNQVNVAVNVSGLTSAVPAVTVTFTPPTGTPVTKQVSLTNGSGNTTVSLTGNQIYNVASTGITNYTASFNPQPLTAIANATETITYRSSTPVTGGRIIGYIPGWKTPPSATSLANAGYTNVMIAFGVFSTTEPGKITPVFSTVSKAYIDQLHAAGIKVSLSLGGASTSAPGTSVDFKQVLQMASSPTAFQQTFVQSVKSLITQYGFDGIDIDIEHGLNSTGTIQNPTGEVVVLANILNQLHADIPSILISMAPETVGISATRTFTGFWATYASLVMKTHDAISWVGVQLYNTGCMLGIDQVCYDPNATNTPNFSVAMATDMLVSWPTNGTGFLPYIGLLRPDQVVLGYPSTNAQGGSDARPVTPNSTIKRAIQCLKTATAGANSCGTYVPPRAFGLIGGVFNWEVTYDQSNNFKFATELKACVSTGACG